MDTSTVLSSRARLARNYSDLPFDLAEKPDLADSCVTRTLSALAQSRADAGFVLVRLRDVSETQRQAMAESHLISEDLLKTPNTSAVLLDEGSGVSVMMNEEDPLRIQTIRPGMDLAGAASACFQVDDALSRQVAFAFDEQLGYLTANPTNTGTGMRASLVLHLPLLTRCKQMGNVGQIVAKVGLTLRGVFGEGVEALGQVYQVSNQVTLGRTEEEIISTVTAVGRQLSDMESALRAQKIGEPHSALVDEIFRAWGVMRYARQMGTKEFYQHWSLVRLGAAMGLLTIPLARLDELLDKVQDANLQLWAGRRVDSGEELRELRMQVIRGALEG